MPLCARSSIRYSVSWRDELTPFFHPRLDMWLTSCLLVDVPMSRVKFNVNTEYAYLQNFKVLQSTPLPNELWFGNAVSVNTGLFRCLCQTPGGQADSGRISHEMPYAGQP